MGELMRVQLFAIRRIHGRQNQNLCKVAPEAITDAVAVLTAELGTSHAVVSNPDEFIDMGALQARSKALNVVSLCPLRYGIGWEV